MWTRLQPTQVEPFIVSPCCVAKYYTRIEVTDVDKPTSLVHCGVNYGCRKFCNTGLRSFKPSALIFCGIDYDHVKSYSTDSKILKVSSLLNFSIYYYFKMFYSIDSRSLKTIYLAYYTVIFIMAAESFIVTQQFWNPLAY